jgi:hypothetical protein
LLISKLPKKSCVSLASSSLLSIMNFPTQPWWQITPSIRNQQTPSTVFISNWTNLHVQVPSTFFAKVLLALQLNQPFTWNKLPIEKLNVIHLNNACFNAFGKHHIIPQNLPHPFTCLSTNICFLFLKMLLRCLNNQLTNSYEVL